MISIIAAIGEKRELGKDNKLLWNLPEDLKRFRQLTNHHPIIMGRKTFDSIGRVLPNRVNIVITRDTKGFLEKAKAEGQDLRMLIAVDSLDTALATAKNEEKLEGINSVVIDTSEIFVIGGGQIFTQTLPFSDRLYLTIIEKEFEADTFFPEYTDFTKEVERIDAKSGDLSYTYLTLDRG